MCWNPKEWKLCDPIPLQSPFSVPSAVWLAKIPCERTSWLMPTAEHKRVSQVPAVEPNHRLSQSQKRFAEWTRNRMKFVNFSTCTSGGECENPGKGLRCENPRKGLRCGVGKNWGGRKSVKEGNMKSINWSNMKNQWKSNNENTRKNTTRIRKGGHNGTSGEIEKIAKSEVRKWPEGKELLDKFDGSATAAGSES